MSEDPAMIEPKGPLVRQRLLAQYQGQMQAAYTLSKGANPDKEFVAFAMDVEEQPGRAIAEAHHGKEHVTAMIRHYRDSGRFAVQVGALEIGAMREVLQVNSRISAKCLERNPPPGRFWAVVCSGHRTMLVAISKD
jgi:hypothetical protein